MGLDKYRESVGDNRGSSGIVYPNSVYKSSEEKAYIVGVIMGDAGVYNYNYKHIKLECCDKEFIEEFGEKLSQFLNLRWEGFNSNKTELGCSVRDRDNPNHSKSYIVYKGIASIFDHIVEYQEGKDWNDLLTEFEDYRKHILKGLWDSEGSILTPGNNKRQIKFSNKEMNVLSLYVGLLHEVVGLKFPDYSRDKSVFDDYNWEEMKNSIRYGDIRIDYPYTDRTSNVFIPSSYNKEFIDIVNPSITRKTDKID